MKCERCHDKEATKALSVTIDGHPSTIFVCDECAGKEPAAAPAKSDGPDGRFPDGEGGPEGGLSLADILLDMAKMVSAAQRDGKPPIFEVHVQDGEGHVIHHASSSDAAPDEVPSEPEPVPECPVCHTTLDMLRDRRRFGCPRCYEVFRDEIPVFTRELQYDDRHVGKVPAALARAEELRSLRKKLRRALSHQRYEEASALSDRIRALGGDSDEASEGNSHGEGR